MIRTGYTYDLPFIWFCLDKYTDLSVEAKTKEGREFAKGELKRFEEMYKKFKNSFYET